MRLHVYPLILLATVGTHCGSAAQESADGGGSAAPSGSTGSGATGSGGSAASGNSTASGSAGAFTGSSASGASGGPSGASGASGALPNPSSGSSGSAGTGQTGTSGGDASVEPAESGPPAGLDSGKPNTPPLADARAPFEAGPGGTVYAFPEAVGFGRTATGGRGGTVVHVTNLSDTGTGSLRDAVSAGNRIVVFDVGGAITISSAISVSSNITIAGQTAPGDGIAIQGNELSFSSHTNGIARYLRVRPGCTTCTRSDPQFAPRGNNSPSSSTLNLDPVSV